MVRVYIRSSFYNPACSGEQLRVAEVDVRTAKECKRHACV